ncbi:solute carrier organic anion transporter family member 6A1 [Pipistrellus kuhlii]|uniref:Solute carrier organic anion transporter family member 6A1 n=1 Tax=Pipistrellus kuhlii TaxID=59472 RepID=A0A7J7YYH1_PIPKU|nr:solute carrier organic anion transporter family member 6A1 [Pipistrellus kuhlii]KAF6367083.1 solute carrier organic anion transporter family member 6A1 [Pipistrellus kuhlii]
MGSHRPPSPKAAAQPQRQRPGLSPQTEEEEPQAVQSQVLPAEPADSTAGKAWHVGVVSNSLIKFHNFQKRKRSKARAVAPMTKKPEETGEEYCGLSCIGVTYCQRFNNIHCLLFFVYMLMLSQGIVFALMDVSVDTFQRGSGLKTIESMLLSSSYDISSCLVVLFIAHYGGRGNILRWLSVSSFLVGFGSLLLAYPYFRGQDYQLKIETEGLMEASVTIGYAFGHAIVAPLVTTPESSIIERVDTGFFNKYWFGTWWIRFVFVTVIAWSTLIGFSCFPRHIKGISRIKSGKHRKPNLMDKKYKDQEFGTSIGDLFASIWILLKTPMFVCLAMTKASESLLQIGAIQYLPKYLENQFVLTPSQATTLSGLVLLPGGAFGQVLGGVIASKLHMYCKGLMRFTMITSAMSLVLVMLAIFVHCDPIPFAGISEDYNGTGKLGNLAAPCNSHCRCSSSFYLAICGRDNIAYFSPCFAGCNQSKTFQNEKTYFNCSCIDEGITISDEQGDFIDARLGKCKSDCYKLPMFIVFFFSMIVFAGFSGIPNMLIILRIVAEKQRSLAMGLTYVFLRVFGTIPGPIVFKMVGETSCTFRDSGQCEGTGSCWIYDGIKMAYLFLGICVLGKLSTIVFTGIAFVLYEKFVRENNDALTPNARNPKGKQKEKKKTNL